MAASQRIARERKALDRLKKAVKNKTGKPLPKGWRVVSKQRSSGNSAGHIDIYYFSPDGARFRSRIEVLDSLRSVAVPRSSTHVRKHHDKQHAELQADRGQQLAALAQGFPLTGLPPDVLAKALGYLSAWDLLQASAACRLLAHACEPAFQAACAANPDWQRRTTARCRTFRRFQWRSLYWQNACRICGAPGVKGVRHASNANCALRLSPITFWLCKKCSRKPEVSIRLGEANCGVQHF